MEHGDQFLRLGDLLLQSGSISTKKLQRALKLAHDCRRRLGDVLVDLGYVSESDVAKCLALQHGFEFVEVAGLKPSATALSKLTTDYALRWSILPVEDGSTFTCVISDPLNVEMEDAIGAIVRKPVRFHVSPKTDLQAAIRAAYGLPAVIARKTNKRKRVPVPESVLQQDREMLLESVSHMLKSDQTSRWAA